MFLRKKPGRGIFNMQCSQAPPVAIRILQSAVGSGATFLEYFLKCNIHIENCTSHKGIAQRISQTTHPCQDTECHQHPQSLLMPLSSYVPHPRVTIILASNTTNSFLSLK